MFRRSFYDTTRNCRNATKLRRKNQRLKSPADPLYPDRYVRHACQSRAVAVRQRWPDLHAFRPEGQLALLVSGC